MVKQKKLLIICLIILLLIILFSSIDFNILSFTHHKYVDFPKGSRPWKVNFGDPGSLPLVIQSGEYAQWKLTVTLKNPVGVSKTVVFYPSINNPDWQHPDNWLENGPFYIFLDMYPTWDTIGLYTLAETTLEAVSTYTWDWVVVDYLDEPSINRKSVQVKYYPSRTNIFKVYNLFGVETNSFNNGETINIYYYVKNICVHNYGYELSIFADIDQNNRYTVGDFLYKEEWDDNFGNNEVITGNIQTIADYNKTINGVFSIGFDEEIYASDNLVWTLEEYHFCKINISKETSGIIRCWSCVDNQPSYQDFPEGTVCGEDNAINYPYSSQPDCSNKPIPGFELLVLFFSIIIILIMSKKKTKR